MTALASEEGRRVVRIARLCEDAARVRVPPREAGGIVAAAVLGVLGRARDAEEDLISQEPGNWSQWGSEYPAGS